MITIPKGVKKLRGGQKYEKVFDESGKLHGLSVFIPFFPWPVTNFLLLKTMPQTEEMANASAFCSTMEDEKTGQIGILIGVDYERLEGLIAKDPANGLAMLANIIAHECLHATFKIIDMSGDDQRNPDDTSEKITYLLGTLVDLYTQMMYILITNEDEHDKKSSNGKSS